MKPEPRNIQGNLLTEHEPPPSDIRQCPQCGMAADFEDVGAWQCAGAGISLNEDEPNYENSDVICDICGWCGDPPTLEDVAEAFAWEI